MAETTIVSPGGYPINIRSKGQGHMVTKYKNIFHEIECVAGVSLQLCQLHIV